MCHVADFGDVGTSSSKERGGQGGGDKEGEHGSVVTCVSGRGRQVAGEGNKRTQGVCSATRRDCGGRFCRGFAV